MPGSQTTRSVGTYQIPDVVLVDQNGNEVRLRALLTPDRPVFLNFIFATCTTICPVLTAGFSSFQSKLDEEVASVRLVSITIDPEHDTPAVLAEYAARFNARRDWTFLTGSRENIDAVTKAFDAFVTKKMNHRPITFIRSPGSTEWTRIDGLMSAAEYVHEYDQLTKH